ncbi:tripartite tricarboxylate transporter TctB family protein [Paenibacillus doosanensis]|uniref:Tripartite tricarboxylate transporter TctB family protein n=1 Tax=Paenibacillus konkukensis TaxID=2020716 RepID=A0ABY4RIJ9_9BACL|nr:MULTISPECIES: tripartite tricarboxylate transporter TctB family protein [Paenibacillus]MCS7460516.1 tripartite tricarboxylate transporter TctB family protein [Paenibacillus doosanensis]UQZ81262.1 Tripartite tricarboxylate transporter TctB family protein [Paenibacillus konkukensis]
MNNAGVWAGLLLLGFGGILFWQSLTLEYSTALGPGPGFLPLWLSGSLMLVSLLYIGESLKKEAIRLHALLPRGRALGNIGCAIGALIVFMLIVSFTGFVIAATALLFIVLAREFRWHWALCISGGISVAVFVIFQTLLDVPLPVNDFGW